jgi:hypothetical protein
MKGRLKARVSTGRGKIFGNALSRRASARWFRSSRNADIAYPRIGRTSCHYPVNGSLPLLRRCKSRILVR